MDRRTFLALSAAGALSSTATFADGHEATVAARWSGLRKAIVINGLGGIENPNLEIARRSAAGASQGRPTEGTLAIDARALREAQLSGLTAVNVTLGNVGNEKDSFADTVREIASYDAMVRREAKDLIKIFTAQDIRTAKRSGRVGLIYGFQDTDMLGEDATRVGLFADLGVRIIQLTYNRRNLVGDGSMVPENRGLTPFGREVVAELNARKVLVDLSHSGERTCLDATAASSAPILISHTGCRALADLPRNKTDQEIRNVATKGGVVGIYFMPFLKVDAAPTADDVVRHVEHALNICGEDHVSIGTDGSITQVDDMDAYRAILKEEVEARRKSGIGATGERPDTYPFVLDLRGVNQFQRLADLLSARGHSSARIEKILGGNLLRVMSDVWPA